VTTEKKLSRRELLAAAGVAGIAASVGSDAREAVASGDIRQWDYAADVVIAGSGAGGSSAAIEARAAGAEVLVLERLPKAGGSSAMSGGVCYLGGGTPIQRALGFADSVEAMHDFLVAAGSLHPPLQKIALYCEGSSIMACAMSKSSAPRRNCPTTTHRSTIPVASRRIRGASSRGPRRAATCPRSSDTPAGGR